MKKKQDIFVFGKDIKMIFYFKRPNFWEWRSVIEK